MRGEATGCELSEPHYWPAHLGPYSSVIIKAWSDSARTRTETRPHIQKHQACIKNCQLFGIAYMTGRVLDGMVCPSWHLDASPMHYDWSMRSMTPISFETLPSNSVPSSFSSSSSLHKFLFISLMTIYSSPPVPLAWCLPSYRLFFYPSGATNCPVIHF